MKLRAMFGMACVAAFATIVGCSSSSSDNSSSSSSSTDTSSSDTSSSDSVPESDFAIGVCRRVAMSKTTHVRACTHY